MLSFSNSVLNSMLNTITSAINSGPSPGRLKIYSGPKPRPGEAITTQILLADFEFDSPPAEPASDVLLQFKPIEPVSAVGEGLAVWCRATNSNNVYVFDGSIGRPDSNSDVRINDTDISIGNTVSILTISIKVSA
jgi:hypothetical protein